MLSTLGQLSLKSPVSKRYQPRYNLSTRMKIPEKYQCILCRNVLKEPVQSPAGNSACYSCYEKANGGNAEFCPIDKERIDIPKVHRDKAKEREINAYQLPCVNNHNGCQWNGKLLALKLHLSDECLYEEIHCEFCDVTYKQDEESEHLKICKGIYRSGNCILSSIGCPYKSDDEKEMSEHLRTDVSQHLLYQEKQNHNIMKMFDEMAVTLRKQNERHNQQTSKLITEVNKLKKDLQEAQQNIETMMVNSSDKGKEVAAAIETSSKGVAIIGNNRGSSNNNINSGNDQKRDENFKGLISQVEQQSQSIDELDLRFQLFENTTMNGIILWKIDRFAYRKQQALLGKITALHSAPSFTSRYGYKFCARLYPSGDGMGKGTHLSLFIVIMKSEYDCLLEWPFVKPIQFTLLNQIQREKNIVEKMVGNRYSSSFQQPVKEMNVATGCPLFASLDMLEKEGFVKNDCLFIEQRMYSVCLDNLKLGNLKLVYREVSL